MLHHHIDFHILQARELVDEPPSRYAPTWDEMYATLDAKLGDYTISPAQRAEARELRDLVCKAESAVIQADVKRQEEAQSDGFDWDDLPDWLLTYERAYHTDEL